MKSKLQTEKEINSLVVKISEQEVPWLYFSCQVKEVNQAYYIRQSN